MHEKQFSYYKITSGDFENKLTVKDEKPTFDLIHKHPWDFNGLKAKSELKVSSTATHSLKVTHNTDIGQSKVELENELTFNTSNKDLKNRFALSNNIDILRH